MKVGDLVKRRPQAYKVNLLTPDELKDIGIIAGFDDAEEYWNVIVSWIDGLSWETRSDIELMQCS